MDKVLFRKVRFKSPVTLKTENNYKIKSTVVTIIKIVLVLNDIPSVEDETLKTE